MQSVCLHSQWSNKRPALVSLKQLSEEYKSHSDQRWLNSGSRSMIGRILTVCGGITNSRLFLQTQADVLQMKIAVPQERESVLLGAAMLGMAASGDAGDLHQVVTQINIGADMVEPSSSQSAFHEAKYLVFREMIKDQLKYRNIMENVQ